SAHGGLQRSNFERRESGEPGGADPGMKILKFQVPSSRSGAKEFNPCYHILDTCPAKTSAGSATADFTFPTSGPVSGAMISRCCVKLERRAGAKALRPRWCQSETSSLPHTVQMPFLS